MSSSPDSFSIANRPAAVEMTIPPTTKRMQRQTNSRSTSALTTVVVSSALAMHQSHPAEVQSVTHRERVGHPPETIGELAEQGRDMSTNAAEACTQ